MNRRTVIFIIVFLQIAFLSSMIIFHKIRLMNAPRILLKTVPYDPVSIFRGYYVDLNYEISRLSVKLLRDVSLDDLNNGDELFVELKRKGTYWEARGIYKNKPEQKNSIYIRGRVSSHIFSRRLSTYQNIGLDYGIESFFVNERSAKDIDQVNRGGNWREFRRQKEERISQLDPETQRIYKASISEWNFKPWKKEFEIWVEQDLISVEQKTILINKYSDAFVRLNKITEALDSIRRIPLKVEVAVDKKGYVHIIKLFSNNKVYN